MFLHILNEPRLRILKRLVATPPVANAYLAGGTALALLLGHRESVDFDWFSPTNLTLTTPNARHGRLCINR